MKGDIKHYFQEINLEILIKIINKKIKCKNTINLVKIILYNFNKEKGMPLGNLTSQYFANIYLNELDYFIKQELKIKYYLRYVDDFIILNKSKEELERIKRKIENFLFNELKLELHIQKSRIINLSKGIDFVGFRIFYYYKLLRKRNRRIFKKKIKIVLKNNFDKEKIIEIFNGWNSYSKWADTFYLRKNILKKINKKLTKDKLFDRSC